ncbi:MAG: M50 family metallopeptidase, partial [Deltaproteobacteria bacterium]|nr:M50 family metallopeptidase [Deltaproteobacteria bacterium]
MNGQPESRPPLEIRFRLGPIPVAIEPGFWLMSLAFGLSARLGFEAILLWVGVVLVSVLVHELGHALVALVFGVRSHISLHTFGGLTFPARRMSRPREIAMSLAGPL